MTTSSEDQQRVKLPAIPLLGTAEALPKASLQKSDSKTTKSHRISVGKSRNSVKKSEKSVENQQNLLENHQKSEENQQNLVENQQNSYSDKAEIDSTRYTDRKRTNRINPDGISSNTVTRRNDRKSKKSPDNADGDQQSKNKLIQNNEARNNNSSQIKPLNPIKKSTNNSIFDFTDKSEIGSDRIGLDRRLLESSLMSGRHGEVRGVPAPHTPPPSDTEDPSALLLWYV